MFRSSYLLAAIWLIVCVVAAAYAAVSAFENPAQFSRIVDLLATIISILIGVSLAVIAVLVSPFSVSEAHAKDPQEADRMARIVKNDEEILAFGQLIFFLIYLAALLLALAFRWVYVDGVEEFPNSVKWSAALSAFVGIFALLWSVRLPYILAAVSRQRKSLGS